MAVSADYQKLVLYDLKSYKDIARPVRSSILTRLCVRKLPLSMMHPNPEDEFCDPAIGPNEGIISRYIEEFRYRLEKGEKVVDEKLMVEKMSTGGYMLLNGHHRWMAAAKIRLKTLPVQVVNTIGEEAILSVLNKSDRQMCVSFDLDEVLLTDARGKLADHPLPFPYNLFLKRTLRKNAGVLIGELQRLGFDVWVYSGSGISEEEIKRLLSLHQAKVNGIVNFMKGKVGKTLKQAFRKKYSLSVHIDNESVMWVNTASREYDSIPIAGDVNWADDAFAKVRDLELLKTMNGEHGHVF